MVMLVPPLPMPFSRLPRTPKNKLLTLMPKVDPSKRWLPSHRPDWPVKIGRFYEPYLKFWVWYHWEKKYLKHFLKPNKSNTGKPLPYDTLDELRTRMEKIAPHLTNYGCREGGSVDVPFAAVNISYSWLLFNHFKSVFFSQLQKSYIDNNKIEIQQKNLKDYFMTDPISRSSLTMAKCIQAVKKQEANLAAK